MKLNGRKDNSILESRLEPTEASDDMADAGGRGRGLVPVDRDLKWQLILNNYSEHRTWNVAKMIAHIHMDMDFEVQANQRNQ